MSGPRLVTVTWPPWASVRALTIASPDPDSTAPAVAGVVGAVEPLEEVRQVFGAIPSPSSATVNITLGVARG